MLEPREADIPALFLFFVVLPVVTYILLGKWNEASKKNSRVSKLAQLAAEEVNAAETMPAVDILQPVSMSMPNIGTHYCARCFSPAKTRCSRCKSVRYCSGKCQIIHWRQGHKQECEQWEKHKKPSATANVTPYENDSADASQKSFVLQHDLANHGHDYSSLDAASCIGRRSENEKDCQTKRNISTLEHDAGHSLEGAKDASATATHSVAVSTMLGSEHAYRRCKLGDESCLMSEDANDKQDKSSPMHLRISPDLRNMTTQELHPSMHQTRNTLESSSGITSFHSTKSVVDTCDSDLKLPSDRAHHSNHGFPLVAEEVTVKAEVKLKKPPYTVESSSSIKHATKLSRGHPVNGTDKNSGIEKESLISRPENNGNCSSGDNVIASTRKSSLPQKHSMTGLSVDIMKTNKVLFPFEELIKFFQCEVYDVYPRGLLNCGNSCYANAVLQCLTCTKPLLVYLLRGVHSRSCCTKEWCLMCELELHVALLREAGGPVSPNKILSNMVKIGCHIGGGNQEDAHEFLRLLVMSMQSICLEGLGGEKEVDARLQDTTLIQQIFGGRLRSKVKCLRCELESERYENIMDLTLEIHGWVESLEDALTQFTAPEDLDGDNMYRCGRCSTYVTARKQLNVHEAPNILTIVLKRFQTGRYGKINKCVTFPDMLDMIPFMTGTCDSPPLYMLYAVVVHLDTFNASFSGHYISYVKDLQGVWFRIDDTEVQPVDLSQVMSEGAYMLFYSRSFPRPPRLQSCKYTTTSMARNSTKPSISRPPKSSRYDNPKKSEKFSTRDAERDAARAGRHENIPDFIDQGSRSIDRNYARFNFGRKDSFLDSSSVDFSDTPHSSDWSIFTSSDESSFTTESTSDSFSTVDNSDTANLDPVSYIFNPSCLPEYNQKSNVSCTKQSRCKPHTRFFSEHRGSVLDSRMSTLLTDTVYKGRNPEHPLAAGNGVISSYARADMVVQR